MLNKNMYAIIENKKLILKFIALKSYQEWLHDQIRHCAFHLENADQLAE